MCASASQLVVRVFSQQNADTPTVRVYVPEVILCGGHGALAGNLCHCNADWLGANCTIAASSVLDGLGSVLRRGEGEGGAFVVRAGHATMPTRDPRHSSSVCLLCVPPLARRLQREQKGSDSFCLGRDHAASHPTQCFGLLCRPAARHPLCSHERIARQGTPPRRHGVRVRRRAGRPRREAGETAKAASCIESLISETVLRKARARDAPVRSPMSEHLTPPLSRFAWTRAITARQ